MEAALQGKTYVVTGATSGIGRAAAEQLAAQGAQLLGVGHSAERCAEAEASLQAAYPQAQVRYLTADLELQSQVRRLAEEIRTILAGQALDGLVNNAGTFTYRLRLTAEGFETQWAVNHLAPFLLTHALLPLLQAAPTARVVTVSSGSHKKIKLNWEDLQLRRRYSGLRQYGQTKLANLLFTGELRRRLGQGSRVWAAAANPGLVRTEIGFKGTPWLARQVWGWWSSKGISPQESARGIVFLATEPSIQGRQELYWKHSRPQEPDPEALNAEAARRLWEISAQMCGIEAGG